MDHIHDRTTDAEYSKANSNELSMATVDPVQTVSFAPPPLQLKVESPEKDKPEIGNEEKSAQLKTANGEGDENPPHDASSPNNTGLPKQLKSGVENLSGFSLDDVKVHYNSDKPAQLQAHAYAQGTDIHLASGQEKHLPHEAWHVVQQKQGRVKPTIQMKAFSINDDAGLEKEADVMGEKAMDSTCPKKSFQLKKSSNNTEIIQQRNWGKTIANIASFGIRKLIVHIQRANQNQPANNAGPVPQADPEDEFVNAYEQSRYYHHTEFADNMPSIEQHGLLNYKDRPKVLGKQVHGMSRIGGDFEGDEKKGVFLGPSRDWMTEGDSTNMSRNVVRAFLPSDRTVKNNTYDGTDVPSKELYRDGKYPGAFITKDSIGGDQVTGQELLELLDRDDPKVDSIIQTVATQYEGEAPDLDTMKLHMRAAIMKRRLSNAPLHDIDDKLMKEDNL
ncbi:eCIS core domain-containing protein [Portibacter lacus]|uniref:eCIS core domain-containing protein n=1 Tax=Portibacter lacus TaxID=1099794 RepID=A0AA37SMA5_9BACT|nr:DUF4157 domain-containing protein [Portibacter lacus]GLR16540.1 hypothetical protein GCM10007940_11550 [Portibacter lacus]